MAKKINRKAMKKIKSLVKAGNGTDTNVTILIQNKIKYAPKISVIVPVYNVEQYLCECLDSIINQTLKEIEIICVDDGSTDNSLNILKKYATKDKRITVITQKNAGSGKARNNAINNSKGKFIAFMDSDDLYPSENTLEHMYNAAIKNNALVCGGSLSQLREGGEIVTDSKEFEEGYSFEKEGIINYSDYQFDYGYWRFIYNRNFLKENKISFPDYLRQQDPPFFVKTMILAEKFYALTEPTYVYRVSYKQISWNERKAVDTVKALTDILECTRNYNLEKLHYTVAQRLINPWFLRAFKLLTEKNENKLFLEKLVDALDYKVIYKNNPSFSLTWFYKSLPNMCKVSIVIPVYNVGLYLAKCLDSVINQTYKNIEIICVNDGSTDNSLEILERYAKKDNRIKIITQKNGGLSAARNTGIDHCNSEFVYFLDSDDYIANDAIETLYNVIVNDNSDVSTSGIECFGDETRLESVQKWCDRWRKKGKYKFSLNIRNDIFPTAWNKIYKMSIINQFNIRFPEGLINEDEYWLWAYMIHCETYSVVDKSLYFYLQRTNSIMATRNNNSKIFDIIKIYNNIYKTLLDTNNFWKYRDSFSSCLSVAMADLITRLPIQMYHACKENIITNKELFSCSNTAKEIFEDLGKLLTVDFIKNNVLKENPKISVIIPVYNASANLEKCLDSIINQTFKDIEIICIDDSSTDNSLKILEKYAKQDNRIAVLKQPNQRQGVARNNGLKYSSGEYIFFCDSDDWLELDCLEKLYNKITKDNSDVCIYGMKTFDNQNNKFSIDDYRDMSAYKNVIGRIATYRDIKNALFGHFYPFDKIYKRSLIIGNNISFKSKIFFEDVIFSIKSLVLAKSISFLDENLYLYRDNQTTSTMGTSKNKDKSEDVVCYLQDVYDFLVKENKYQELENEYLSFAEQQITYHINRMNDVNIKYNFICRFELFIARNGLNIKNNVLQKLYQTVQDLQERNKVLVVEINDCHGECLPGYIKYFQDLGYDVDALINEKQKQEQPLCMFNNMNIMYASENEIIHFLNSCALKKYSICLFNSNIVYTKNNQSIFDLFNNPYAKIKNLCVEHRLENIPVLSRKAICLILKSFRNTKFAYEVNPHYFGDVCTHARNKIINFIVVGNIDGRRKNYDTLIDAVQKLHNQKIDNFKITVVGKGNVLDIPEEIRSYFDIKGRLSYPDMYKEMQNADYFLPLLDPSNDEHERYIKTGTSGSFQLIYGFKVPCLIADKFAHVHGFNRKNSIVYNANKDLPDAMLSAIKQQPSDYNKMQKELSEYSETLYKKSLDNFKHALDSKVSKRHVWSSFILLPYYLIKTAILKKELLKHQIDIIKARLSECRVDIRNFGNEKNNINIDAEQVNIQNITWDTKQGGGKYIQCTGAANKIKIKAVNDGILKLEFKGRDIKFDNKRIPVWIDYKSIKIDGKEILDAPIATWHDKPYRYEMPVKDGQEITLEIEQQYHEYVQKELEELLFKLNFADKYLNNNMNKIINFLGKRVPVVAEKTNYFVSLGENCFVRTVLTRHKLKPTKAAGELSCPFDLCVSSLPQTEYIIETLFADYFDGLKFDKEKGVFVNERLALTYNHDTDCVIEQDLINRYRHRIDNFLSLQSRKELVFVVSSVNPNMDYKAVNSLYVAILSAFKNTKICFVFVDISKEKMQNSDKLLKEINYKNIPNPYPHYLGEWYKDEFYNSLSGKDFENKVCSFIKNISEDKNSFHKYSFIKQFIRKKESFFHVDNTSVESNKDALKQRISDVLALLTRYRFDVKNFGTETNDIDVFCENANVLDAKWLKDEHGAGKIVQGTDLLNTIKIKAIKDGVLKLDFRGVDKVLEGKRIPVWIDYKSIKIDGKEILKMPITVWHDKPYHYEMPVKDGQEVVIEIEQQYHGYTEDELKDIILKLNLTEKYDDIKPYVSNFIRKIDLNNPHDVALIENYKWQKKIAEIKASHKTIKIKFDDLYQGLNEEDNNITRILKKFYNVEFSDQPDFLFYSCFGTNHLKYKNCVKIFFTGENVLPNFNECDYAYAFDYIDFGDRYIRTPINVDKSICDRGNISEDYANRRFCNFIFSNTTSGEGALLRQQFCEKLMQYKHVDCPGRVLNNMSSEELEPRNGDWHQSKIEFLKKYKFTIAFENSSSNGYTTEKMLDPLTACSVPIYWGNPLVTKDFNPRAFINANDYNNDLDAIIERVKELDNNPELYLAMLRENPMQKNFDFEQHKNFERWLVNIIERGNKPFNSDPRGWGTVAKLSETINLLKKENLELCADIKNKREPNMNFSDFHPFKHREQVEWSNTWIENAVDPSIKRILIIGDSVARQFRGNISAKLENYAVDYIGLSQSFEDPSLYRICETFFAEKIYNYSLILLNVGNQHGLYLHTKNNDNDKKRYINGCRKFFEYVKNYSQKLVYLTATPNSVSGKPDVLNEERNSEIQNRNGLQTQIAKEMDIPIIDLYALVINKKFKFIDIQHFANPETQDEFADFIISDLKRYGLIDDK